VAYYQQVGRAGRSLSAAVGVLMSGQENDDIQENFRATAFPFSWDIELVLSALCNNNEGLSEEQLEQHCNLRPRDITRVTFTSFTLALFVCHTHPTTHCLSDISGKHD